MKKYSFFLAICFIFFTNNTFAQKNQISNEETLKKENTVKKIKTYFCDCFNNSLKDFSPQLHKIFDKMAKEIRTKSKLTLTPMQKYFENNKAEYEKFEKLTENDTGNCDFDFEDDLGIEEDEFLTLFSKNVNEINALMKKDKECNKGLVIFNLWLIKINEKK